jgi:hypothetical protein
MNEPESPPKDPIKEGAEAKRAIVIVLLLVPIAFVLWLWLQFGQLFAFMDIPDRTN